MNDENPVDEIIYVCDKKFLIDPTKISKNIKLDVQEFHLQYHEAYTIAHQLEKLSNIESFDLILGTYSATSQCFPNYKSLKKLLESIKGCKHLNLSIQLFMLKKDFIEVLNSIENMPIDSYTLNLVWGRLDALFCKCNTHNCSQKMFCMCENVCNCLEKQLQEFANNEKCQSVQYQGHILGETTFYPKNA